MLKTCRYTARLLTVLAMLASLMAVTTAPAAAQVDSPPIVPVDIERVVEDVTLAADSGIGVSADGSTLFVVESTTVDRITVFEARGVETDTLAIGRKLPSTGAMSVVDGEPLVVSADATRVEVVTSAEERLGPTSSLPELSTARLAGAPKSAWEENFAFNDATQTSYTINGNVVVAAKPVGTGNGQVEQYNLQGAVAGPLDSIAIDQATGEIFVGVPSASQVAVLDPAGNLDRTLDFSGTSVDRFQSIAVAPSHDLTDGDATSMYLITEPSVAGESSIVEMATTTFVATAAATTSINATLVKVVNGSSLNPDSPDSAGLTWTTAGGRGGRLLMSDSEVNEYNYYDDVNLWELNTNLTQTGLETGTTLAWSGEPTGVAAYDSMNRIFTTDDVIQKTSTRSTSVQMASPAQAMTPYSTRGAPPPTATLIPRASPMTPSTTCSTSPTAPTAKSSRSIPARTACSKAPYPAATTSSPSSTPTQPESTTPRVSPTTR